jgi:hypothetical protein
MNDNRRGISGALAAVLGLGALVVGMFSGLVLGAAGGFFVARQLSDDDLNTAEEQRASDVSSALDALTDRGNSQDDDGTLPEDSPSLGDLGQIPAMPGLPGITIVGPDSAFLGVEVGPAGGVADEGSTGEGAGSDDSGDTTGDALAGAQIISVTDGSAAQAAGLVPDDLIVALDGEPILSANDLATAIGEHEPGDEVTVTFLRDGRERELQVTLGHRPGAELYEGAPPELQELFDQMPPEMREHFRDLMRPKADDTGA